MDDSTEPNEASANEENAISDIGSEEDAEGPYYDWNYSLMRKEYIIMNTPKYIFTDILSDTTWSVLDVEGTSMIFYMADELNTLNYNYVRNIPETKHVFSPLHNANFDLVIDYLKEYNYFTDALSSICDFDLEELEKNIKARHFIIHYITPMIRNWDRYCANVTQLSSSASVEEVEEGWERAPEQFLTAIQMQTTYVETGEKDKSVDKLVWGGTKHRVVFTTVRKWLCHLSKIDDLCTFLLRQQPEKLIKLFSFTYWYYYTFFNDYCNDHSKGEIIPQLLAEEEGIFVCFMMEVKKDQFSSHWFAPFHLRKLLPQYKRAHNDNSLSEELLQLSSFGYRIIFCKTCRFECPLMMPEKEIECLEVESSPEENGKGIDNADEISPTLTRTFSADSDFSEAGSHSEEEFQLDYELLSKNRLPKEEGVYVRQYLLEYNSHSVDILNKHGLVQVLEQDRIAVILEQLEY